MKNFIVIVGLIFVSHFACAKDEDCPSAVDAAEAQNPNAYKDCDYTKTGLNGVLHRALSKSSDTADAKDEAKKEVVDTGSVSDPIKLNKLSEFNSPQQLQTLKFALLEKTALECPKGFVVEGERYLPTAIKALKLELIYHCL